MEETEGKKTEILYAKRNLSQKVRPKVKPSRDQIESETETEIESETERISEGETASEEETVTGPRRKVQLPKSSRRSKRQSREKQKS